MQAIAAISKILYKSKRKTLMTYDHIPLLCVGRKSYRIPMKI